MSDRILEVLKIKQEEFFKVAAMAGYLFLAVSCFITGRISRDALFLKEFDREMLAYMYITVGVAVPLPAWLYAKVADKFRRDHIIQVTLLTLFTILGVTYLWLNSAPSAATYIFLYNFVELLGAFLMIQFWTFAGDIFASREAKRLFPVVGGGGVLAGMLSGVTVGQFGKAYGADSLLLLMMGMLLGCFLLASRIGKRERVRLQEAIAERSSRKTTKAGSPQLRGDIKDVFQSKHLKIIAGMTVATFITVPLVDYQFKVMAKDFYTSGGVTSQDGLTHFFGLFYTLTGVVAAVTQFGFTGRILERFGVVTSLMVLPVSLLIGTVGTITARLLQQAAWMFPLAVYAKGAENSFRYSIYDATMQVIYTPVPGHVRGRAKTFIDGILKPWSQAFAGVFMAVVVTGLALDLSILSYMAFALVLAWCGLVLAIRREYVAQLLETLRKRRLDFSQGALSISDEQTVSVLRAALRHDDLAKVRNALALAPRVEGHDLSDDAVHLLKRDEAEVRRRALLILAKGQSMRFAHAIQDMFEDEDPAVRAEAVRAFCAVVGEPAIRVVQGHLLADSAQVRGAAVASLIKHGGLEGILLSAEHLKEMQTSADHALRLAAAEVFGEIKVRNFYQPVLALLRDPSLRVQAAAIRAAGAMRSTELIPALVYKLSRRETARAAGAALVEFGPAVVPTLGKVLGHAPEDPHIRRQIPRILERIGTREAFDILIEALHVDDPDTRREAARSAARLREKLDIPVDADPVRELIDEEIRAYYQRLAALDDLAAVAGDSGPDLLRSALEERMERTFDRIFRLLGIIYPLKTIELIQSNLKSTQLTVRSNAVEVLDNLLERDEKRKLLPIVEDLAPGQAGAPAANRARVLERGQEFFPIKRQDVPDWVRDFLGSKEPWLVVVALYVVRELGLSGVQDQVLDHTQHSHPVARETALRTLEVLMSPPELLPVAEELAQDRDAHVRRYAKACAQSILAVMQPQAPTEAQGVA